MHNYNANIEIVQRTSLLYPSSCNAFSNTSLRRGCVSGYSQSLHNLQCPCQLFMEMCSMSFSHTKPFACTTYFSISAQATDRFVPFGQSTNTLTTGLSLCTREYYLRHSSSHGFNSSFWSIFSMICTWWPMWPAGLFVWENEVASSTKSKSYSGLSPNFLLISDTI